MTMLRALTLLLIVLVPQRANGAASVHRSSSNRHLRAYNMFEDIQQKTSDLARLEQEKQKKAYDVLDAIRSTSGAKNRFFIPPGSRSDLGKMLEAMGGFR